MFATDKGQAFPTKYVSILAARSVVFLNFNPIIDLCHAIGNSPGRVDLTEVKSDHPLFFAKPAAFRAWLEKHHQTKCEQWVGFHRKASGRPSITWPEAVDEAICFGWIDGLRKKIDAESYKIRFTPRRPSSNWSAVNIARMNELVRERRVRPAGIKAFQKRLPERSGIYSYENRKSAKLGKSATKLFRGEMAAWDFFQRQPASYRQTAIWWVVSAKRPQTQQQRLRKLIALSKVGRRI